MVNLQKRYSAVGNFLSNNSGNYFVEASLVEDGVRVRGNWYPIIKMDWVKGEMLNQYIERNLFTTEKLNILLSEYCKMISHLEVLGIAHGDLQHGNILIDKEKIHLVDYDGIYLPSISDLESNIFGHINY